MKLTLAAKLAWQQLLSQYKSGDLRVLLFALVLAVSAITAVNFFTNRIGAHLNSQGGLLLGGDATIISDHPIAEHFLLAAQANGLQTATTLEFASMAINGEQNRLADVKALGEGFPLRGDFGLILGKDGVVSTVKSTPKQGEVWLEPRLADAIKANIGDYIELGASRLKVSALLALEPSRGGDMFGFAPRLMMNAHDVAATQLIQFGSRVKYQLLVTGTSKQLQTFTTAATSLLQRGERIEDVKTARPEIKSALDKAETFLGLSAMVSVVLSVVAMLLASAPFVARNQQVAAMLRTFGANKSTVQLIMFWQTVLLAIIGGVLGCLFGFIVQAGLAYFAGQLFLESLPAANFAPALFGMAMSFAILFALMTPQIQALKNVPAMRILRDDYALKPAAHWRLYWPIAVVIIVLIFWIAKTAKLALAFLIGVAGLCLVAAVLGYGLAKLLQLVSLQMRNQAIAFGLANLKRRIGLSVAQIIGFSLGAMVLILLVMIKNDLLQAWQASLPADAPNRFVINVQADQVPALQAFINQVNQQPSQVFPMIRGRLMAINDAKITPETFTEDRAKRLAEREFNLSSAASMQPDNKLLQGRWWRADEQAAPYVSIEEDIAKTLNIKLGDRLRYDIAGSQITLTVTSVRKVEWDSMRANFFAVTPPQTLVRFQASYMSAFYLPKNQDKALNQMLQQFPNFTVIDVASMMNQVREMMRKLSLSIGFVFSFCMIAGLAVLYSALIASRDARKQESALLRVLGASRAQVSVSLLTEFACIGAASAFIAVSVASGLAYYLSQFVLDIPYQLNLKLVALAFMLAMTLIPLAAWLGLRAYLNVPPKQLLNSI